jgi:predicted HTH transcriptional regulator
MTFEKDDSSESQIVEYKESWRDEYLKWLCGFANAQGGVLYIGVRDDGTVCGVDIVYQDEIHGSLLQQADTVIDLIYTKYLTAPITYKGITRVETYPYPREAVREAVLTVY